MMCEKKQFSKNFVWEKIMYEEKSYSLHMMKNEKNFDIGSKRATFGTQKERKNKDIVNGFWNIMEIFRSKL